MFGDGANTLRIGYLHLRRIEASLEAATQKGLKQAIVQRVAALLAPLDVEAVALQVAGDFSREQLVPQCPAKTLGDLAGDVGRAASVFALNRQHFDHECLLLGTSVDGNSSTGGRVIFPHYERKRKHDARRYRQDHVSVDVSERLRLH